MEPQIDFSNLETFLDSAQAILMQKIQEADLNPETRFDLEYFGIAILRNQVKEVILKYVENPESDQWIFKLLKSKNQLTQSLKLENLCKNFNTLDQSMWKDIAETILNMRENIKKDILIKKRDENYYTNSQNVLHDLQAFSQEIGLEINKLKTSQIDSIKITCANGELVLGETYLNNAAQILGLAKNAKETSSYKTRETLSILFKTAGIEIPEYPPRDTAYYTNPQNVLHDLQAFADEASTDEASIEIHQLNTNKINFLTITCANGEPILGQTYLHNTAQILGLAKNADEATSKRRETLSILFKTAGIKIPEYPPRDKAYYTNPQNILHDLQAFADEASTDEASIEIHQLKLANITSSTIICANRETIIGLTYLNQAARILGLAKNSKEATSKRKEALLILLKSINIEITEYPLRDTAYYTDPQNVLHDLQALSKKANVEVTELNTSNTLHIEITCANGEIVKGQTYLENAAIQFGVTKKNEALIKLLQVAQFKVREYFPRDEKYYSNPANVLHDLKAFADKAEIEIGQLNTNNIDSITITCANGETTQGTPYIHKAARNLKLSQGKASKKNTKATLRALLEIAKINQFSKRDKNYYLNPKNAFHDLKAFTDKAEIEIGQLNTSNTNSIEITCANGETVKGQTYFTNAARQLGLSTSHKEDKIHYKAAIRKLIEIANSRITK